MREFEVMSRKYIYPHLRIVYYKSERNFTLSLSKQDIE